MNYNNFLNRDYMSLTPRQKTRSQRGRVRFAVAAGTLVTCIALYLGNIYEAGATREVAGGGDEAAVPLDLDLPLNSAPMPTQAIGTEDAEVGDEAGAPPSATFVTPVDEATGDAAVAVDESELAEDTAAEPSQPATTPAPASIEIPWQTVTVKKGDSLSRIFNRLGLSAQQLYAVINADERNNALTRLLPGQELRFHIVDEELRGLRYTVSHTRTLAIDRQNDDYRTWVDSREVEKRLAQATGIIESSLYLAGQRAGLSDKVIMELAGIFGWDVDFALDIRAGDSFTVIYEQEYLEDEKVRDGAIIAAEFVNQGRPYRAIRFADAEGNSNYFDPNGMSMRKAFLRSPVDFRRISSRFQRERYHPVLGKRRPHRGVDYAAAIGTPIKSAGDGKVVFRGWKGGYGRTVIIQHGQRYSTLYAHMSSFRSGVDSGSRVRQGQTIGYVGKSGLATGPHLHYEFRIDGVHRNPLTVSLPNAEPIGERYKDEFAAEARQWMSRLDDAVSTQVVLND